MITHATHVADLLDRLRIALAGRYTFERELGRGGMATVYLATDLKHHRGVAIKVLKPELSLAPERFLQEIEIAATLAHPHIVPLYDSGAAEEILYYVMPYIDGESLRDRLAREPRLPMKDVCAIAREIADALDYAHKRKVVHRDIKPGNVLLWSSHAVVADFGVAKALDLANTRDPLSSTGLVLGTPPYMAPEQAVADPATDHRADLYALGVLTYEMLAGRRPYQGVQETLSPVHVSELRPDTPTALATLVMRCLSISPNERPQHAGDVVSAIDALPTPSGGAVSPRSQRVSRRQVLLGTVLASMILLIIATALLPPATRAMLVTLMRRPDAPLMQGRVLVVPFSNETGDTTVRVVGVLAAEWIGRAVSTVRGLEVVDPQTALTTETIVSRIPWPLRTRDQSLAMAQEVGATTLVSGTIYREGDSLLFLTKITDVKSGRLVRTLEPISSSREAPLLALTRLQQRVAGSLAQVSEVSGGMSIGSLAEPPSLAAYEEVYRGMEAYLRGDDSSQFAHFERAAQLDTMYTTPLVFLAFAHVFHFQYEAAESAMRRAESLSERLTPAERALLDHLQALMRGDRDQAVITAQRFLSLVPGSQEAPLLLASVALSTQRPKLALAALAQSDPNRGLNLVAPVYWIYQAKAAGEQGDWKRSLAMARTGVDRFPQSAIMGELTASALARLNQVPEMEGALARLPSRNKPLLERAQLAIKLWGDLESAGVYHAATNLVQQYARLMDGAASDTTRESRYTRGGLYWRAGRLRDAQTIFSSLAAADTGIDRLRDLGQLGITSARLGDGAAASLAEKQISDATPRYQRGTQKLLQAEIAAALNERARAVSLLREGLALGLGLETLGGALIGNPDLQPLYGFLAFEELLKPSD
ncbi:MAG TPA: protein kinase [Gemmatimonadaceae bacterium]